MEEAPYHTLIPLNEAAPRLGRHPKTLRYDLRQRRIPGVKIGNRWFISSKTLDDLTGGQHRSAQ
jgi:hypothetical protein